MNARAKQLAEIGRKAFGANGEPVAQAAGIIDAIAAMLAAPAAKAAKPTGPTLPFSPQDLHQALQARVGHIVVTDLVNGQMFGFAGKKLKGISGLEAADLERLVSWIEAGGLAWMTKSAPTFQTVVHNLEDYLNRARDWDRRGRPTMTAKGSNTPVDTAAPDVNKAFGRTWRSTP